MAFVLCRHVLYVVLHLALFFGQTVRLQFLPVCSSLTALTLWCYL